MITEESNINIKPRNTLKVGDLAIIHAATKTKLWHTLFYKNWSEFVLLCLKQYLRFSRSIMAFQLWSVFRWRPGFQTMGLLSIGASLCVLLSYNSTHVEGWLKPVAMFIVPFVMFFKSPDEIYELIFIDVESRILLIYTILFTLSSLIHLVTIWVGKGNKSITKRGESLLGLVLSKFMKVDEFVIGLCEVLILMGLGLAAYQWADDPFFGLYTVFIGLAEASQLILDKAYQAHTESILKA